MNEQLEGLDALFERAEIWYGGNRSFFLVVCYGWGIQRCFDTIREDGHTVSSIDISRTPLRRLLDASK